MTQPLNYTKKAWRDLRAMERTASPVSARGLRYLTAKLERAETFTLPDYGTLFDRGALRPQLPNSTLRLPFPVVALEYEAPAATGWRVPGYTDAPSSRRIALAWDWKQDLPAAPLPPGIVIMSISFFDQMARWFPATPAALHIGYDDEWFVPPERRAFEEASLAAGRTTVEQSTAPRPKCEIVPILGDVLAAMALGQGTEKTLDLIAADTMDEANAFLDLCQSIAFDGIPSKVGRHRDMRGRAR